jgi:type I site-specific restriction-modification system R (restriction) subunit
MWQAAPCAAPPSRLRKATVVLIDEAHRTCASLKNKRH